jgi:hypothetical protein
MSRRSLYMLKFMVSATGNFALGVLINSASWLDGEQIPYLLLAGVACGFGHSVAGSGPVERREQPPWTPTYRRRKLRRLLAWGNRPLTSKRFDAVAERVFMFSMLGGYIAFIALAIAMPSKLGVFALSTLVLSVCIQAWKVRKRWNDEGRPGSLARHPVPPPP